MPHLVFALAADAFREVRCEALTPHAKLLRVDYEQVRKNFLVSSRFVTREDLAG